MRSPGAEQIARAYRAKGFRFFADGDFNLNIFGIRAIPGSPNKFDDLIGVIYRENGVEKIRTWQGTTDPGTYWLEHPMYPRGTAIVAPGQYLNSHSVGQHGHPNGYEALVQTGNLQIILDNNRDGKLDYESTIRETGKNYGINIHHAGSHGSTTVDLWSAGCQVFADPKDFSEFMDLCRKAKEEWGNHFTYTLFLETEVGV